VKWLELLKQIAPLVTRVAVLRDPTIPAGLGLLGAIQSVHAEKLCSNPEPP
jgi:putative tryptophan/tyrosine transport system substrate-binding protein